MDKRRAEGGYSQQAPGAWQPVYPQPAQQAPQTYPETQTPVTPQVEAASQVSPAASGFYDLYDYAPHVKKAAGELAAAQKMPAAAAPQVSAAQMTAPQIPAAQPIAQTFPAPPVGPTPIYIQQTCPPVNCPQVSTAQTQAADPCPRTADPGVLPASACYGANSKIYAPCLKDFIDDECDDACTYAMLAMIAPTRTQSRLCCRFSCDERRHMKRWQAAYLLITGQRYRPRRAASTCRPASFAEALRTRYIEETNGAQAYRNFAANTTDPCLKKTALEIADDEQQHADLILDMLQGGC